MSESTEFTSDVQSGDKVRNWFLTINNPESTELPKHPSEKYAVWQLEKGASGTPHLQATIVFANAVTFGAIKELYPTAHIQKVKKLPCAIDYCQKEDTREDGPWERGTPPKGQGKRTDIELACEVIKSNIGKKRPLRECAATYPTVFVKMSKGLREWANEMVEARTQAPEVHVYFGGTGAGKSTVARTKLPEAWIWNPAKGKWFDGYLGQQEAIFEEYRGQLPYAQMLSILDRYTHEHQVKNGFCNFVATKIAITSPVPPAMWYPQQCTKRDSIQQLLRRITKVYHCVVYGEEPIEVAKDIVIEDEDEDVMPVTEIERPREPVPVSSFFTKNILYM
jgi:hypothetical protein